ncbi:zn 2cys6 transcription factor [Paraphaeosphaeria minitans]|uniref:Zn 2cys6 transcription factor n=1 Tax=Paraphaeosphaeria minitans TaxID=565426 RepID=A0A9P6GCC0_9PLEO|nr:zn 2cys6 transcription factor [Paraphaeosphaeria minitans]
MTITGKCDTCRSRKVKCDEQKPQCGACRKRDRDCIYLFGKASAFVLEDPTQLSKHGRPKVAPVIYPIECTHEPGITPSPLSCSPPYTSLTLRQSKGRDADKGQGVFMTLSGLPRDRAKVMKKTTAQQRRKLQIHLNELDATIRGTTRHFLPSKTALATRYVNLLGSRPPEMQPFAILGSWVESLPSRIGRTAAVDLAVEYLIESFNVSEAMIASRTSVYDNDVYLEMTSPASVPKDSPATFRASVALMHVYIQVPRLICLVRHASNYPEDSLTLTAAMSLAEALWELIPGKLMREIVHSCITIVDVPPYPEIADIIPDSYHFDSIENSTVISRFWKLQVTLSGIIQTLYQRYPAECVSSQLPPLSVVENTDADAATELARCIHWAFTICPSLPLVPLRIYTTFQVSVGAWCRIVQRITASNRSPPPYPDPFPSVTTYFDDQLFRAKRMEQFVADKSNLVHELWNIPRVNKRFFRSAAIDMAGGPIPDWMPIRITFDTEDGSIVMRMELDAQDENEVPISTGNKRTPSREGFSEWVSEYSASVLMHADILEWYWKATGGAFRAMRDWTCEILGLQRAGDKVYQGYIGRGCIKCTACTSGLAQRQRVREFGRYYFFGCIAMNLAGLAEFILGNSKAMANFFFMSTFRVNVFFTLKFFGLIMIFSFIAISDLRISHAATEADVEHINKLLHFAGGFGFSGLVCDWYLVILTACEAAGILCPLPVLNLRSEVFLKKEPNANIE